MTIAQPIRRLVLLALGVVSAACIGPQGGHREGKGWPTEPQVTHLQGRVLDFNTGQPLPGAKVSIEFDSIVALADGAYLFGNLRVRAVNMVSSMAGYDTVRIALSLPANGTLQYNVRLRPAQAQ